MTFWAKFSRTSFWFLIPVFTAACASQKPTLKNGPHDLADKPVVTAPTALSHEMAWLRSHQISKASYTLWFGIDEQSPMYDGRTVIQFDFKDTKKSIPADRAKEFKDAIQILAIDFEAEEGAQLHDLILNGTPIPIEEKNPNVEKRFDGHRIYFHSSELVIGANRVEISFTQRYSKSSQGFYRFKDPEDGSVYLYTNSEPYGAHKIFPCFDQPDIKASFELSVEAPEEWEIISNTRERDVSKVDGRKSWSFPPSPVFSTYLFELAAGPYMSWKADASGIPLRLFARKSLKKYVDHDEWLDITRKGLSFYNDFYGYPYPYAKLDQILIPDFDGAMENVAAITFSDSNYLFKTRPTLSDRRERARDILHEMAHQWFGDLVTMKWWNGLWLNESFATYMSSRALEKSTRFPGIWQHFFASAKSWAYATDQLVTTHPIEVPVIDTDEGETNFDGITYGKGASVLKQLDHYLGDDDFKEGLLRYFMRFALRNATTHEFMKALAEASSKDLTEWQKSWLQTSGVNGLRADWTCDADGGISQFKLVQSPAEIGSKNLRTHLTRIAFFDLVKGKPTLRAKDTIDATYASAETPIPDTIGKKCPAFVFPNVDDEDYVKVELDPVSLAFASAHIGDFNDPLLKLMLWSVLWSEVVDAKIPAQPMLDMILSVAPHERDSDLLERLQSYAHQVRSPSLIFYLPDGSRKDYADRWEALSLKSLKLAAPGSDSQRLWFDAWVQILHSQESMDFAHDLLTGKHKVSGLKLDQPIRWMLVKTLAREGAADAQALIDAERKIDVSDEGVKSALSSESSMPDAESRKKWIAHLLDPLDGKPVKTDSGITLDNAGWGAASDRFQTYLHDGAMRDFADAFYASLPKLKKAENEPFRAPYVRRLFPMLCDASNAARVGALIAAEPDLPPAVEKQLKIKKQEEERCVRARAKAQSLVTSSTGQ